MGSRRVPGGWLEAPEGWLEAPEGLILRKADIDAFLHDIFLRSFDFFQYFSSQQLHKTHFLRFPAKFYVDSGIFSHFLYDKEIS